MSRLLLVEDDPILGRGLSVHLKSEGYSVDWAESLKSARSFLHQQSYHLVILDLTLPDGDGLSLLRYLREQIKSTSVMVLTAQINEETVVEALQSGASDYVRKPFSSRELFARISNILKKPEAVREMLSYGQLEIDLSQRRAKVGPIPLDFNRRELDVLIYLVQNADRVVTREALLQHLSNAEDIFDRTVDSYVYRIRTRLRSAGANQLHISSEYGLGYRLQLAQEASV